MTDAQYGVDELLAQSDWVRRLAFAIAGNPHDAEDLHQEAMRAALARPPMRSGSLRAWFRRVVRNRWLETRRSERSRRAREQGVAADGIHATDADAGEEAQRLEASRLVIEELQALEEPYKTVLLKIYYGDMSAADVARELGCPADTVRSHHRRGLERLRRRWSRRHEGRAAYLAALFPLLRWGEPPAPSAFDGLGFPPLPRAGQTALLLSAAGFLALVGLVTLLSGAFDGDDTGGDETARVEDGKRTRDRRRKPGEATLNPSSGVASGEGTDERTVEGEGDTKPEPLLRVAIRAPEGIDPDQSVVRAVGIGADGTRYPIEDGTLAIRDGLFRLPLERLRAAAPDADELEVRVDHRGALPALEYLPLYWRGERAPDDAWDVAVDLRAAWRITGDIEDESGRGLPGADVRAFVRVGNGFVAVGETPSGAGGAFELRIPGAGRYVVATLADHLAPAFVELDAASATTQVGRLVCRPGFEVAGSLRDATGRGASGLYVGVWQPCQGSRLPFPAASVYFGNERVWRTGGSTLTDANGRYRIAGLGGSGEAARGAHGLTAGGNSGSSVTVDDVKPGPQPDLALNGVRFTAECLRDGDGPVHGLRLDVRDDANLVAYGHTDDRGLARFLLPPGSYRLEAGRAGAGRHAVDIVVPEQGVAEPTRFELPRTPPDPVLALVFDEIATEAVSVALRDAATGRNEFAVGPTATFAANGGAVELGSMPSGTWTVTAFPGGRRSVRSFLVPVSATVTIPDAGRAEVRFPAPAVGGRLRVRALAPDGSYATDPTVLALRDAEGQTVECGFVQRSPGGREVPSVSFFLPRPASSDRALPPGRYEVQATHDSYGKVSVRVTVTAGETTQVDLRFPKR